MIRYILVDDNQKVLNSVKAKIDALPKDYDLQHIKSYNSSKKAYEEVRETDYDLLIVDFEMPIYDGLELAQKIGSNKKIIFLTSTSNNEQKVINNLDISGFLSKPFEIEEFEELLKNKVIGKIKPATVLNPKSKITLNIGANKDIQFKPEQVYYIGTFKNNNGKQPKKNCVNFYEKNDCILHENVLITINQLEIELADYNFKKIKKNCIINMDHFKERDNTNIKLFDTKETFEVTTKEKSSLVGELRTKLKNLIALK